MHLSTVPTPKRAAGFVPRSIYKANANPPPQTGPPILTLPHRPVQAAWDTSSTQQPYQSPYQQPHPYADYYNQVAPNNHYGGYPVQLNPSVSAGAGAGYYSMDYSQYGNAGYTYPPGYADPYAQQQQYQATPPQIRNPFGPPPAPRHAAYASHNANYDPEYEAALAQWQSAYAPQEEQDRNKRGTKPGEKGPNPNLAPIGVRGPAPTEAEAKKPEEDKKKTVVRKGGGQTWEDQSLLEWDPTQFRIMVGNLAGEVTDDSLAKAFAAYGVSKARVVRDKRTTKSKGYGFVSFIDGEQGFKAAREMVGKYIGSHPVTIQRSKTDIKPVTQKNDRHKGKNNKGRQGQQEKGGKKDDPLRANTGAHIEKKPVKNPVPGMKMLG